MSTKNPPVTREDPPADGRSDNRPRGALTASILDAVRAEPGTWFRVNGVWSNSTAASWRRRHPEFEFVSRRLTPDQLAEAGITASKPDHNRRGVWVRYPAS